MGAVSSSCLRPVARGLVKFIDSILDRFQDVPTSLTWAGQFNNAFHPVSPVSNLPLTIKSGKFPSDLSGAFLRIGPNAQFWPPRKRTHVFDGDGMVHVVRITGGVATYHCDFIETPRYKFERMYGKEWFIRLGEFHGVAGLLKILTVAPSKCSLAGIQSNREDSVANTAVTITPEGKLWALNEGGAPFHFRLTKEGVPQSIGYDFLNGTLPDRVSAHPKVDHGTNEIFYHGRELMKQFYVGRIVDGKVTEHINLKMPDGFHHDMCITEKYVIIVDGSMSFSPKGIVKGQPLWNFLPEQKLRFGVYPRATGKMSPEAFIWIEASSAAEIVHTLHAYDDGDKIIIWAPVGFYQEGRSDAILGEISLARMRRIVIDVSKKTAEIEQVEGADDFHTEFPRIRDDCMGKHTQYGYSGLQDREEEFRFSGVLKWDFEQKKLDKVLRLPDGIIGGEPVFIPRADPQKVGADDHGYIGMFLWNELQEESTFALFDAHSFEPAPVLELLVPRRVPLGFHAHWINEDQFQQQLKHA